MAPRSRVKHSTTEPLRFLFPAGDHKATMDNALIDSVILTPALCSVSHPKVSNKVSSC